MTIQIIRNTEGVITSGKFCKFGSVKKSNVELPTIFCDEASSEIYLRNRSNYLDLGTIGTPPKMDVYINDKIVLKNATQWLYGIDSEFDNISFEFGFETYTDSSNRLYIVSTSYLDKPLKFRFVPTLDGEYGGNIVDKKLLILDEFSGNNNSAVYDEKTGVITFCLLPLVNT